MPEVALVLLAVYGALALGVRVAVQLWRTGSTGIKGPGGSPGSPEWLGGVLFILGIAASVSGADLARRDLLDPIGPLDGELGHAVGLGVAVAGIVATFAAQLAMGDAWRIGVDESERTELVTGGPFALVRNPIYSAMVPFFAGIALLVPNVMAVGGAVAIAIGLEIQTRLVEEPYLRRVHGEAYASYAAHVGRFVPGVGRLRDG